MSQETEEQDTTPAMQVGLAKKTLNTAPVTRKFQALVEDAEQFHAMVRVLLKQAAPPLCELEQKFSTEETRGLTVFLKLKRSLESISHLQKSVLERLHALDNINQSNRREADPIEVLGIFFDHERRMQVS